MLKDAKSKLSMEEQTSERMRKQLTKLREQHNELCCKLMENLIRFSKNLREETAAKQKMLLQAEKNIRVAEKNLFHHINEQKEMESQYATHATKLEKKKDEVLRAARTNENYLKNDMQRLKTKYSSKLALSKLSREHGALGIEYDRLKKDFSTLAKNIIITTTNSSSAIKSRPCCAKIG